MKQLKLSFLFTMLISMVGTMSFAYDIAVENEDGIIIYYNYINDRQELEVVAKKVAEKTLQINDGRRDDTYGYYDPVYSQTAIIYYSTGYEKIKTLKIPEEITVNDKNIGERTLKVTSIGDYAFAYYVAQVINGKYQERIEGGPRISNLYVPETITHIGKGAFCYLYRAARSCWVNGVYTYPYYELYKRDELSSGIIYRINSLQQWIANGGNITEANTYRLSDYECHEITDIVIPESSQSLSENLFKGCSSLKSITLPNNMSYIGSGAFNCENLTTVISLMKDPVKIYSVFSENTIINGTLYVPKGTKSIYESTEGWKDFVRIEEGYPAGIKDIQQERSVVSHYYNLNGHETSQPIKGINIMKMNDGTTKKVFVK